MIERSAPVINEFGQLVGHPVEERWIESLATDAMVGQFCLVETLDVDRHGAELFEAFSAAADHADWTYLPYGPFEDQQSFTDWLHTVEGREDPMFHAVLDASTGRAIGVAAYLNVVPRSRSIEIGHIHFSRTLQRTPAATEAMYLLMRRAFACGYRRYEWKCDDLNLPSRRAAARLGFDYEGTFRKATHYKGRSRDTAWFSIIEDEWPIIRTEFERWLDPANFEDGGQLSSLRTRT